MPPYMQNQQFPYPQFPSSANQNIIMELEERVSRLERQVKRLENKVLKPTIQEEDYSLSPPKDTGMYMM